MPTLQNGVYNIISAFDPALCIDLPVSEAGNVRGGVNKQLSNGLVFQQWAVEATDVEHLPKEVEAIVDVQKHSNLTEGLQYTSLN